MRNTLIFILMLTIFFEAHCQIKIDTLYSGKNEPFSLYNSRIIEIIKNLENDCVGKAVKINQNQIEYNREYNTMWILNSLNNKTKNNIFIEYDALVVAYFCEYIEPPKNDIHLFEFHFNNNQKAQLCKKALESIYKNKKLWEDIGTKNWHIKIKGNILYLLMARMKDSLNPMKVALQKKIESL